VRYNHITGAARVFSIAAIAGTELGLFCRRHRISRAEVFASTLRDDFMPDGDVDLLVEFEPDGVPGLVGLAAMGIEISALLGRRADIHAVGCLSRHFREEVVKRRRPSISRHDPHARLAHMLDHAVEAMALAASRDKQAVGDDGVLVLALVRLTEVVGRHRHARSPCTWI
jgi:predicted nucleotidyltransferase